MPLQDAEPDPPSFEGSSLEQAAGAASPANDLDRRREIGQFFTPPPVAGFVWELLEVIHGDRFPAQTRVVDPACGEGVFLRVAAERGNIAADSLFGTDIDGTLANVWRHDPALKAAHLFVGNGLLDSPDRGVRPGSFDVVVGNPPFAGKGLRDLLRLLDETDPTSAAPEVDLFGTLTLQDRPVPPGPPLKAQERAQLDHLVKELGQYACWRLSKDADNGDVDAVGTGGASDMFAGLRDKRRNGSDEFAKVARMVSAWPLNRPLDPRRPETRLLLRRLASMAIEVVFMERFLRLARPGGLIAVIVPESIVASDQQGPLRTWLLTEMDLLAVVSLPQKVFVGVGANARTSVVFARRRVRPRVPNNRARGAPNVDLTQDTADDGTGPAVQMAAPNTSAPGFSLEAYLASVLQHARQNAKRLPPKEI